DLAVDTGALRADHVDLGGVDIAFALQRPELEGLGLAVEFDDRGLIHIAEPQITVAIAAQAERAGREARLVFLDRKFRDLAGLRVKPAEILFAEAGIPDH